MLMKRLLLLAMLVFAAPAWAICPAADPGCVTALEPPTTAITFTKVTCGTTTTAFGVTGYSYLGVFVPTDATAAKVCFAWNASSATLTPPSECVSAGGKAKWGGGTGSCIVASGTQDITVETK